jgi:hypothetical protein
MEYFEVRGLGGSIVKQLLKKDDMAWIGLMWL